MIEPIDQTVLDPTGGAGPRDPQHVARRPASLDGMTIGLLDISKPRGNVFLDRVEEHLARPGLGGAALRQAHLHQAGADRPPPGDRRAAATWSSRPSPIEAAARRAVCTTSPISRAAACRGCSWRPRSSSPGPRRPVRRPGVPGGRGLRGPSDPGPHRRRDASPGRRRHRPGGGGAGGRERVLAADLTGRHRQPPDRPGRPASRRPW